MAKVNKPTLAMKTIKLLSVFLVVSQMCSASPMQSLKLINEAVHSFVESSLIPDGKYEISNAQIDNRLHLPECQRNLDVFSQSGMIKPGRNTVGVRCDGTNGWTIYTTVLVRSFKNVLILAKPLTRNEKITSEHLISDTRDVAMLQQGYLTDPEDVVNKQATRSIPAGTVLNRQHYTEPTLVKRGQHVSIQSSNVGFLISAKGIAMMDGCKGEQIRVKNISSKRVIQATIANPGVVTVNF